MARDYIDIGSAPAEEDCAQVGSPDYTKRAREECIRFIELIRRTMGDEPPDAYLAVKRNSHDFGEYYSVVCYFEDDNDQAQDYAFRCEDEAPIRWDNPPPAALVIPKVCDSCLEAAREEGIPDRESQELLMMELGGDIADHLCDQVEAPTLDLKCACACRAR